MLQRMAAQGNGGAPSRERSACPPKRIALIGIGSTGDVQPMIALGHELARRGHDVSVTAFAALRPLVEEAGLPFAPLPGDAQRYISGLMKPGASALTFLHRLETSLKEVANPLFDALYDVCRGAEAVVTSFFGSTPYSLAEKLNIPIFQAHYYPMDITGDCSVPVLPPVPLGREYNRMTYRLAYLLVGGLETRYSHRWCRANGIRARRVRPRPDYRVANRDIPVLYAISPTVLPRPAEWAPNIHLTGFWQDEPAPFAPPEALEAFLAAGEKPVYIGFGSMKSGTGAQLLRITLEALRQLNLRAVLAAGWGEVPEEDLPDTVYLLRGFVPHGWLFERVAAAVHHGGAGTTASSLRAGIPTLVVPFGGDQYFWGSRVHALGCGPKPLSRSQLTAERFAGRLQSLTATEDYARNARQIARALRSEHGTQNAADLIEQELCGPAAAR